MSANRILFGTTTLYRVAASQIDAVRQLLSQCPKSTDLEDILLDLEAISDTLKHDAVLAKVKPTDKEVLDDLDKQAEELEVLVAANKAAPAPPVPVPTTVKVGPFTIQTTIPDDAKLVMLGTPILAAYAKHFGVEDRTSKDAMIKGLKAKRDQVVTLRPFDLRTLKITQKRKDEMMAIRWDQRSVDAFCKGAGFDRIDLTLFIEELTSLVPYKPTQTTQTPQSTTPKPASVPAPTPSGTPKPTTPAPTAPKPSTKPQSAVPSKDATPAEVAAAQKCGLKVPLYRILACLADGKERTYRQIEAKTGYYSTLTAQLRVSHLGSLGNEGYVTEQDLEEPATGKNKLHFTITKKGLALLKKAVS